MDYPYAWAHEPKPGNILEVFSVAIYPTRKIWGAFLLVLLFLLSLACAPGGQIEGKPVLKIGGIPDQNASRLARRYDGFANYLSQELKVPVEYVPSVNYAAVVTAFTQGDLQVAFFGGLTGVQARLQNPGAQAIVRRENDAKFHSKFIVRADLPIESLADVKAQARDLTITFGSPSSTSGHLMPRHFLSQAGIDPDTDFRYQPNYSGSHDATWQLVESGAFDVGALNEEVWGQAVREARVDTSRVKEFYTTPDYFDYHWTVRADLDQVYGEGFSLRLQKALLDLNPRDHAEILELFSTDKFVVTNNANYQAIEDVGRQLEIIR